MTHLPNLNQFKPKDLCIAVTGDNHLGHSTTSSLKILSAILGIIPDSESSREINLFVINGDLFDNPLMMTSDYRGAIIITFYEILKRCKKYDICLRILEGTPSHDYHQSRIFDELNQSVKADCKYVETLSIEYNEKYNSHWLFVPDEWRSTAKQTQEEVVQLLAGNGIQKVDYAFMHGYFAYQLPDIATEESHDIDFYQSIVEYNIFINHVHVFSQKGKVTAPGSIERLAHNEEGDKGYVIRKSTGITFVINNDSTKYVTVNCVGLELENAYNKIREVAVGLSAESSIRIKANRADPILSTIGYFKTEYPKLYWSSVKADKKDSKTVMDTVYVKAASRIPTITKENIHSFLIPRLKEKNPLLVDKCLSLLEDIING